MFAQTLVMVLGVAMTPMASGQDPPPKSVDEPPAMHWATRLGLRTLQAEAAFPVVDQVVLVPDAATYLDELTRWSPSGRWPVLFEDDLFAAMFIRRFQPARVLVRESIGALRRDRADMQTLMERVVATTWGGENAAASISEVFAQRHYLPPGVVIASADDPAWTAAVALAAGRGQVLGWMDEDYGRPDQQLDEDRARALMSSVEQVVATVGHSYATVGDVLDTITVCRAWPGRIAMTLPPEARIPVPERFQQGSLALTDVIGRRSDWSRYAFSGWIFGDERRCAYVAMCSLFLSTSTVELVDTYPEEEIWASYHLDEAMNVFQGSGYGVELAPSSSLRLQDWGERIQAGRDADLLLMNSRGAASVFFLADGRARAEDIPIQNAPVAVHLIHSWSLQSPENRATVGGRWLTRGVYAYVGAVHEPLLNAFVPPTALANRISGGVPFLVAARWWASDGVFSRPWRVNTFGDPLKVCPPQPPGGPRRLLAQPRDDLDLDRHVRQMIELIEIKPALEVYAETVRSLVTLGRDEAAISLWQAALAGGVSNQASEHVLGPLFRAGLAEDFLTAWPAVSAPDDLDRDMLWHLVGPRLDELAQPMRLDLLWSAIRPARPHIDASRLAPHVDRELGRTALRVRVEHEIQRAPNHTARRELQRLLEKYPG